MWETWVRSLGWEDTLEKGWLLNPVASLVGSFPCGSTGTESACNAGDLGSVPGLGRSPGEGKGYPLSKTCFLKSSVHLKYQTGWAAQIALCYDPPGTPALGYPVSR